MNEREFQGLEKGDSKNSRVFKLCTIPGYNGATELTTQGSVQVIISQ